MAKTYLFIDGSNLYGGQHELFGPDKYLDFTKFIQQVKNKLKISFDKIYFYASYSPIPKRPSKKEKLYLKNEALFYRSVRKTPKTLFFKGYRSKTSGKEKEVDVKLAVDIVDFAHRNLYDKIYFVSGDADFLQALVAVRKLKKRITVLCLSNKVMFRALFIFKTYIFYIGKLPQIASHKKQKLRFIKLSKKVVSKIK